MLRSRYLVEYHPCDPHVGIEGPETVDYGGHAAIQRTGIHDQDNRKTEQFGDVCRRTDVSVTREALVETSYTLDDAHIGILGRETHQVPDGIVVHEERIQIPGGSAGGCRMVHGIDEIGTDLVSLHPVSLRQYGHYPRGDRGLPYTAASTGDHESLHSLSSSLRVCAVSSVTMESAPITIPWLPASPTAERPCIR